MKIMTAKTLAAILTVMDETPQEIFEEEVRTGFEEASGYACTPEDIRVIMRRVSERLGG